MVIIVRYSEIGIKGDNRSFFENKLVDNIKKSGFKLNSIVRKYGRIIIYTDEHPNLRTVLGISSFSFAEEHSLDFHLLAGKCVDILKHYKTFSISCQRLNKSLPFTSVDFAKKLSEMIIAKLNIKVNLTNPEKTIFFELIDDKVYFFSEKIDGFDGLPLGSQGNILSLINEKNDILAALLMMKRGCTPIIFKKEDVDISLLKKFSPFNLEIHDVEDIKNYQNGLLIIGQDLKTFNETSSNIITLRPLIGFNDEEINKLFNEYERA